MAVISFASDRYRLRLTLDNPLPQPGEGRSARAFDRYLAELVRDDDRVCAFLDVYLRRFEAERVSYIRAAAALGSEFLVRVCLEALTGDGDVQEYVEATFEDAMTDVYVFDELHVVDSDAERPVLRGIFMQELMSVLSHGLDVFFINARDDEFQFWRDTLGARRVGHFIAASGARPLPIYPRRSGRRPVRQAPPRLRVLGRREPN